MASWHKSSESGLRDSGQVNLQREKSVSMGGRKQQVTQQTIRVIVIRLDYRYFGPYRFSISCTSLVLRAAINDFTLCGILSIKLPSPRRYPTKSPTNGPAIFVWLRLVHLEAISYQDIVGGVLLWGAPKVLQSDSCQVTRWKCWPFHDWKSILRRRIL